jgi:tRNA(Ile)-lysidine synthase
MTLSIDEPSKSTIGTPVTSAVFSDLMFAFGSFVPGEKIGVAVSGGPDSMALCRLTCDWAKERDLLPVGLTVDHRLRPQAAIEAEQVRKWLEGFGMQHETLAWDKGEFVKHLDRSPQAAARDARFSLLCQWCKDNDATALMTAHHADDQAETFLYRLIRGSGVDGLAAMAAEKLRNEVRLLRPLLGVTKADLIATCAAFDQRWVVDPSNAEEAFARVRLRKIMAALEEEGLHRDRLLKTVAHMQRAKVAIDRAVDELMHRVCNRLDSGQLEIDILALRDAPEEVALRFLTRCLMDISGAVYPPRFDSLIGVYRGIGTDTWSDRTLHGCQLRKIGPRLVISLELRSH